jgi:hypothetical protein
MTMENVLAISETTYQQLATLAGQQHCTPEAQPYPEDLETST